jgi:hypothetical protein
LARDKNKKSEKKKKAGKKASQLAIRVEKAERDAFVALCERLDTSAAREIRSFMRGYVERHKAAESPAADLAQVHPVVTTGEEETGSPASVPKRKSHARKSENGTAVVQEKAPRAPRSRKPATASDDAAPVPRARQSRAPKASG